MRGSGALRERLVIQTADPRSVTVSSLTRSGTTATAQTIEDHGYSSGDYVTIAGADQAYNGRLKITVTGVRSFTFTCAGGLTTPATGAITATYASDAQGGRRETWRTLATIPAELIPNRGAEQLQVAAIQSDVLYRFRVRVRADLRPTQRVQWTPAWPPQAERQTLEISSVLPVEDGRAWQVLDCAVSSR